MTSKYLKTIWPQICTHRILYENLAESVLNHQSNGGGQINSSAKQMNINAGSNVSSGIEKSMQRLSMVIIVC